MWGIFVVGRHDLDPEALNMSWLKRILTGRKEAASSATPAPRNFRLNDDVSHNANADILEGVQFIATLHVTTPVNAVHR